MRDYVIGIDIGGSHITAAHVDLDVRTVVKSSRKRERVDARGEAGRIVTQWGSVINSLIPSSSRSNMRIGIAMPGPFDYNLGVSYIKGLNKYESLYGLNIKELIADVTSVPVANILLENDAACFLHGEMFAGAGRGCAQSVGVTLGTGTGTAIHQFGVTRDANLGPSPFLDSIADDYLSTRWLVGEYRRCTGQTVEDGRQLAMRFGNEPVVREIFKTFGQRLALLLKDFVQKENPRVVIVGGNIANAWDYFMPETELQLASADIRVPIIRASLGEDATMLGAAFLFSRTDRHQSPRASVL